MGHSLGEYAALVAAGAMPFDDALEAVAARGHEMTAVSMGDNGLMAAVFAPLDEVQAVLDEVTDYVVIANLNSTKQAVIGGSTPRRAGGDGHAHRPGPPGGPAAGEPRLPHRDRRPRRRAAQGGARPAPPGVADDPARGQRHRRPLPHRSERHRRDDRPARAPDRLARAVRHGPAHAVRRGLPGVRRGRPQARPPRHGRGRASRDDPEVTVLFTNHPKQGDVVSFNQALTGLYAAGLGARVPVPAEPSTSRAPAPVAAVTPAVPPPLAVGAAAVPAGDDVYVRLGHVFADALAEGAKLLAGHPCRAAATVDGAGGEPVVITGAGLALPGRDNVFGDDNVSVLLHGTVAHRHHPGGPPARDRRQAHHPPGQVRGGRRAGSRPSTAPPT